MAAGEQPINPDHTELAGRMIQEAKRMASERFKEFKKRFKLELDFTSKSKLKYSIDLLGDVKAHYNLDLDVRNSKEIKAKMTEILFRSNDIFLEGGRVNQDCYETYCSTLIDQYLILKKIDYLEESIKLLVEEEDMGLIAGKGKRIKWLGKPSQMGHLIKALIDGDYIAAGKGHRKEELSLRSIARIIYSSFIIPDLVNEGETSFENFYREVRDNSSTDGGKSWLNVKKRFPG